jgi:hypothetical protein
MPAPKKKSVTSSTRKAKVKRKVDEVPPSLNQRRRASGRGGRGR